ncbi:MAG: DUF1800 domain-containing protein [Rubrivivax sp.]|nr:DUF1800 domain-containing protein [Rubrivivax sp.]
MTRHPTHAAIAAHRFGPGEPGLDAIAGDPKGWLLAQQGPADVQRGNGLVSGAQGIRHYAEFLARQRQPETAAAAASAVAAAAAAPLRAVVQADVRARLATAATSTRPFAERLALFWANHFTVSLAKNGVRGAVGAFEREAIRPHTAGRFETLLQAAVTHAAMLRYLDNDLSAGADSPLVRRQAARPRAPGQPGPRITGLNENLAREVLELHTLGANSGNAGAEGSGAVYGGWGGYTQADVTAFAAVLTGWRIPVRELLQGGEVAASRFEPAWHQPGPKTVLGKTYPEGPDALAAVLHDLARHPSTARFVCTKLARHFVADTPPPALVARLEASWRDSDGDLAAVSRSLVLAPEAWQPQPVKLKTPEEFVISSVRLLGLGETAFSRVPDGGIGALGQRVQAAPSPAGWPDRAEEWLGPDAVWKRVEWATRVADRMGRQTDARALAAASLGALLQEDTARQIARAADGPQALALLLLAPEFQRR